MTTSYSVPAATATDDREFDEQILKRVASRRRTGIVNSWVIRIVAGALFLVIWYLLSAAHLVDVNFISTPWLVAQRLGSMLTTADTWYQIWSTFEAALIALAIGTVLGVAVGVLFDRIPVIARAFNPFVTVFNALPRPALAPLFILWFGLGITPKVVVGVSIVFFILLVNTVAGLAMVDPDIKLLTDSLGPTKLQRFWKVDLPTALPSIVAGLRLGAVYSVLGVVVSEMVSAYTGLGVLLVKATNSYDITGSMSVLILMAASATALDLLVRQLQRRVGSASVAGRVD